jgi:thioredoxin-like negative regulator of GroEL
MNRKQREKNRSPKRSNEGAIMTTRFHDSQSMIPQASGFSATTEQAKAVAKRLRECLLDKYDFNEAAATIDALVAENKRLKSQALLDQLAYSNRVNERDELREDNKRLVAESEKLRDAAERYRKAAQMAVEMIETAAHERRHVRWALMEAMKGAA